MSFFYHFTAHLLNRELEERRYLKTVFRTRNCDVIIVPMIAGGCYFSKGRSGNKSCLKEIFNVKDVIGEPRSTATPCLNKESIQRDRG
ncbi:hypothetical protein TNCT_271461 [Trichonephila clavata]|uniref:Uncharacterized protein n=1 Tax=Trichonephila clavata TaxID=2740835 RepID=A0A8X6F202_TRICU|nr:hypothetical protein TNCT_271461 [Trichonephila clavata]